MLFLWQTKCILVKHLIYREENIALVFLLNALSLNSTDNIVIAVSCQGLIIVGQSEVLLQGPQEIAVLSLWKCDYLQMSLTLCIKTDLSTALKVFYCILQEV